MLRNLWNRLRNRRGTEIIQVLIVLAVFGAITVGVGYSLSDAMMAQNDKVVRHVENLIDSAVEISTDTGSGGSGSGN